VPFVVQEERGWCGGQPGRRAGDLRRRGGWPPVVATARPITRSAARRRCCAVMAARSGFTPWD